MMNGKSKLWCVKRVDKRWADSFLVSELLSLGEECRWVAAEPTGIGTQKQLQDLKLQGSNKPLEPYGPGSR